MPKRRYTPEEIVAKLREVDVLVGQGKTVGEAVKSIGDDEQWKGMPILLVRTLPAVSSMKEVSASIFHSHCRGSFDSSGS
jgi:hypothetical protein